MVSKERKHNENAGVWRKQGMRFAQKKRIRLTAFRLGQNDPLEKEMILSGKLRLTDAGQYEVFSLEAKNGKGQIAAPGDYIKIDSLGGIYPNQCDAFESAHIQIGENTYEQITQPVQVWFADEPMDDTVRFLLDTGRLRLNETDPERYFNAELWGAPLSAARDSALVLYFVERNDDGTVTDAEFNFVVRKYFDDVYEFC